MELLWQLLYLKENLTNFFNLIIISKRVIYVDYNKLIEYRAIVSKRICDNVISDEFELSIKMLTTIHEKLFKDILFNSGHFRHFNISREEEILNLDSVMYPDYHTIAAYLKFAFQDEAKLDYSKFEIDEVIEHIAMFTRELWLIHPFSDGNTRTVYVFIEKYLKSLGYESDNNIFKDNAIYFRNALVRASYANEDLGIMPSYMALNNFFRKVLVDNNINLESEYLYIPELYETKVKKKRHLFRK